MTPPRHVWIRDYTGDTGIEPSATWTASGWTHAFWESPDITTSTPDLVGGSTVTLTAHISNDGPGAAQNVTVEAYYNDPRITLEFPDLSSVLIGSQNLNVPPSGKDVDFQWPVPTGTNSWGEYHWCVGVVVRQQRDMALTTKPERSSNVGLRNFQTRAITAGELVMSAATNAFQVAAELVVRVDSASLPRGWKVEVLPPASEARLAEASRAEGPPARRHRAAEPGATALVPVRVTPPTDAPPGSAADVPERGGPAAAGGGGADADRERVHVQGGGGYRRRALTGLAHHQIQQPIRHVHHLPAPPSPP